MRTKCVLFVFPHQAELAEEDRMSKVKNRTTMDKCRLYSLRIFISFVVTVILVGAVYAIYITVEISSDTVSGTVMTKSIIIWVV